VCGIHGILALDGGSPGDAQDLSRMAGLTRHRGPDDEGSHCEGPLLLGMRRLSIIDLSGGHQPISNEDGTLWVVCNGEIYNFRELRAQLEKAGHTFKTASDTEVIVHAYEEFGDRFVHQLDGMFAFALWDARQRRLLIGRDPIGIKPLYYRLERRRLLFASEAKAILAVQDSPVDLSGEAVEQYLGLGYVAAPLSIFRGIRKLPPASMLIASGGKTEIHRYWSLPAALDESTTEEEWSERVRAELERAVAAQMVSDVPLGAFLSGGIDSSAVVAFMSRASAHPVRTYSIGFAGSSGSEYYNELPYAGRVARQFGTQHREIVVQPDVAELLPKLLWHLDEPMADAAFVTTYLVSEFARREVTVILSGVGGDELFGGYRRYQDEHYRALYERIPEPIRRGLISPLARLLPSDRHHHFGNLARLARSFILSDALSFEDRYRAYVQLYDRGERGKLLSRPPEQYHDAIGAAFESASARGDGLRRLLEVDFSSQLPDDLLALTDRMSMASSLECRVPLLDQKLVEMAARMPASFKIRGRQLKYVMKKALADVLPREILYRPKRGFGAPMGAWLKRELRGLLGSVLSRESVERRGLLRWPVIERTLELHAAGRFDYTDHLLALMNLELWCRVYLDRCTPADVALELKSRIAA
jgi:asparagine synthase (glutamine-hydrolysing)